MTGLGKIIQINIVLLVFIGCTSKSNQAILQTTKSATEYIGEWRYNFPFYSSELIIDTNGCFQFHEQGCMGQGFSRGNWTINGTNIELTSFKEYSREEIQSMKLDRIATRSSAVKKKNKKGKIEFLYRPQYWADEMTFGFGPSDTTKVYFNKVQLSISSDTLYCLDGNGNRTKQFYITAKKAAAQQRVKLKKVTLEE